MNSLELNEKNDKLKENTQNIEDALFNKAYLDAGLDYLKNHMFVFEELGK